MARGIYTAIAVNQTISTAITILEITAPSTAILKVTKAWVGQSANTISGMQRIQVLRKSATITGAASPPSAVPLDAAAGSGVTVKWKATGEGTDGNVLLESVFNVLSEWVWVPHDGMSGFIVPPSGIIALKFPAAPTSSSFTYGMVWEEIG